MIDEARESNKVFRLKAGIILLLVLVVYIPAVKGDFAEAHNDLAKVLVKIGQTETAATHFREAERLRLDP